MKLRNCPQIKQCSVDVGAADYIAKPCDALGFASRVLAISFRRHQSPVRTSKRQLNPKRRGNQNVYFPALNFLQIACGDFGAFGQFVLRQFPAHPLAAHVRAEDPDPLPFFFGNCHDILHRFYPMNMNDTYIVKFIPIALASTGEKPCNYPRPAINHKMTCEIHPLPENQHTPQRWPT
jgi:hypothetical protein